jgi:hypothetical protein
MDEILFKLKNLWSETYYVNAIIIPISAYLLWKSIRMDKRSLFRTETIFFFAGVLLLFTLTPIMVIIFNSKQWPLLIKYNEINNLWFNCLEVFIYFSFFNLLNLPILQPILSRYIVAAIIICFILIGILFFQYSFAIEEEAFIKAKILLKAGEITDVSKHLLILIPCIFYFHSVFKKNQPLIFKEVLVVYALFTYCIFDIVVFSIAFNLGKYSSLKYILIAFPSLSIIFLCLSLYFFSKNTIDKSIV